MTRALGQARSWPGQWSRCRGAPGGARSASSRSCTAPARAGRHMGLLGRRAARQGRFVEAGWPPAAQNEVWRNRLASWPVATGTATAPGPAPACGSPGGWPARSWSSSATSACGRARRAASSTSSAARRRGPGRRWSGSAPLRHSSRSIRCGRGQLERRRPSPEPVAGTRGGRSPWRHHRPEPRSLAAGGQRGSGWSLNSRSRGQPGRDG